MRIDLDGSPEIETDRVVHWVRLPLAGDVDPDWRRAFRQVSPAEVRLQVDDDGRSALRVRVTPWELDQDGVVAERLAAAVTVVDAANDRVVADREAREALRAQVDTWWERRVADADPS